MRFTVNPSDSIKCLRNRSIFLPVEEFKECLFSAKSSLNILIFKHFDDYDLNQIQSKSKTSLIVSFTEIFRFLLYKSKIANVATIVIYSYYFGF